MEGIVIMTLFALVSGLIGWLLRGQKVVYAPYERKPKVRPIFWALARKVRDGKDLPALAEELDDICNRFRHFMTMGEVIYNAHPESDDRKMFRQILDEGWEVYGQMDPVQ